MPKKASSTASRRPKGSAGSRALTDALYRCAKQDPQRRFHALYDKVGRPDMLARAWSEVLRACLGSDGSLGYGSTAWGQSEQEVADSELQGG